MKLQTLLFAAALAFAGSAFSATPTPAAGTGAGPAHEGMCKTSPDQCQQLAAKFDQWCTSDADKCTAMKAHIEKRREWCENNKEKCKQMMQKMHAHRGQNQSGDDDDTTSPPSN